MRLAAWRLDRYVCDARLKRRLRSLARSLARSLDRAMCTVWRWRFRWRSVTPRVTRSTRATPRRASSARTRASSRHNRSPSPHARSARARCGGGGARSLARSCSRGAWRWRWRWRWRPVTPRVIRVMRTTCGMCLARVRRVITAHHQRFPFELSLARDRHARASAAVALDRLLALSRAWCGSGCGGGGWLRRTSIVPRASCSTYITHTHSASSPRVARVITVSRPPNDRHARCGGGGVSIVHAVWRWRRRWRSVTTRVSHVMHVMLSIHHLHTHRAIAARRARHHRSRPPRV